MDVFQKIFIVLLGIWSVVCQNLNANTKNSTDLRFNPNGFVIPENLQLYGIVLPEAIQDQCSQIGKPALADKIKNNLRDAVKCIASKVNPKNLQNEFMEAQSSNTLDSFYVRICSIWPEVHACINSVLSEATSCLKEEDRQSFNLSINIMVESNKFYCQNNAYRTLRFFKEQGSQCTQKSQNDIQVCLKDLTERRTPKDDKTPNIYTVNEYCSDIPDIRKCVVKTTMECQSKAPAQILDEYFEFMQKKLCSAASNILCISKFNALLLTLCIYLYKKYI